MEQEAEELQEDESQEEVESQEKTEAQDNIEPQGIVEAQDKNETQDKILLAALKLFAQKGFFNTSLTDIAKQAGLKNTSAVYPQFKNKFIPWLSIIDVMMFNSKGTISEMLTHYEIL